MKRFTCQHCHNEVHFENTACVSCGQQLGVAPRYMTMLSSPKAEHFIAPGDGTAYAPCANRLENACNWLVNHADGEILCRACRLNRTIPDMSDHGRREAWRNLEQAKRYLVYSLIRWRLPLLSLDESQDGALIFDFLADTMAPDGSVDKALTGHDNGLITINIAEADDAERERRRLQMDEPYRTLLGHFRHEVGHYYWDRLVRDGGPIDECRALFGDETTDYTAALQHHYQNGPPKDWARSYISTYATSHPWEDFAETFAHYVHMVDTLETARAFGMEVDGPKGTDDDGLEIDFDPYRTRGIGDLIAAWVKVTVAVNAINRSMGQPDLYPFVLSTPVEEKLAFIHRLIRQAPRHFPATGHVVQSAG